MSLIYRIQESGRGVDASIDDWFFKDDVKKAIKKIKRKVRNHDKKQCWEGHNCLVEIIKEIDEIIGDLNLNFDDIDDLCFNTLPIPDTSKAL